MNMSKVVLSVLLLVCPTAWVSAEEVQNIRVGAKYYWKGVLSETEVRVLAVDRNRGKVQIQNLESGFIEWVAPSEVITPRESVGRDIERVAVGAALIKGFLDYVNTPSANEQTARKPAIAKTPEARYSELQLREKAKDEARSGPFPKPPNCDHKSDEVVLRSSRVPVTIGSNKVKLPAGNYILIDSAAPGELNKADISHVEYSLDDHWLVVVALDGTRADLGQHLQWNFRPYWRQHDTVFMISLKDGKVVEIIKRFNVPLRGSQTFRRRFLGLGWNNDSIVNDVTDGSPAAKAGIRVGDQIVSVNGDQKCDVNQLALVVAFGDGSPVTLEWSRNGKVYERLISPAVLPTR